MAGLKSLYLGLYNWAMFFAWSYVGFLMIEYMVENNVQEAKDLRGMWAKIGQATYYAQFPALLEIFNAVTGIVKTPFMTTFMQVMSRVGHLSLVEMLFPESHTDPFITLMVASWTLTEVIRYLWFAWKETIGEPLDIHTKIRYSTFLVLYPTGITGEWMSLYHILPYANRLSIKMPNKFNFVLDGMLLAQFILFVIYPFGAYTMYTHMLAARKKVFKRMADKQKTA
eukprot:Clim_evm10s46 gene=Clim_evmTU10s46